LGIKKTKKKQLKGGGGGRKKKRRYKKFEYKKGEVEGGPQHLAVFWEGSKGKKEEKGPGGERGKKSPV